MFDPNIEWARVIVQFSYGGRPTVVVPFVVAPIIEAGVIVQPSIKGCTVREYGRVIDCAIGHRFSVNDRK